MRLDDDLKYFESEEFKEILDRFEAMEASGTMGYMDADDLADVADYYSLVCHDEEHASEVIDLALRLHPDAIAPYLFKARQCLIAKKYKEAEAIISSISEQDNREVIFLRAEVLICRGETAGALAFINEIDASEDMTQPMSLLTTTASTRLPRWQPDLKSSPRSGFAHGNSRPTCCWHTTVMPTHCHTSSRCLT